MRRRGSAPSARHGPGLLPAQGGLVNTRPGASREPRRAPPRTPASLPASRISPEATRRLRQARPRASPACPSGSPSSAGPAFPSTPARFGCRFVPETSGTRWSWTGMWTRPAASLCYAGSWPPPRAGPDDRGPRSTRPRHAAQHSKRHAARHTGHRGQVPEIPGLSLARPERGDTRNATRADTRHETQDRHDPI